MSVPPFTSTSSLSYPSSAVIDTATENENPHDWGAPAIGREIQASAEMSSGPDTSRSRRRTPRHRSRAPPTSQFAVHSEEEEGKDDMVVVSKAEGEGRIGSRKGPNVYDLLQRKRNRQTASESVTRSDSSYQSSSVELG